MRKSSKLTATVSVAAVGRAYNWSRDTEVARVQFQSGGLGSAVFAFGTGTGTGRGKCIYISEAPISYTLL